jgi:hypothetical protein
MDSLETAHLRAAGLWGAGPTRALKRNPSTNCARSIPERCGTATGWESIRRLVEEAERGAEAVAGAGAVGHR